MESNISKSRILLLSNKELKTINGGGEVWKWLGKLTGYVKNGVESAVEWVAEHDDALEAPRPIGMY
jgi:bacteriocin-like protein